MKCKFTNDIIITIIELCTIYISHIINKGNCTQNCTIVYSTMNNNGNFVEMDECNCSELNNDHNQSTYDIYSNH